MRCDKCGYQLNDTSTNCPCCNNRLVKGMDKKKLIVIGLLSVVVLLLGISAIVLSINEKDNIVFNGKRTIMIYMVGSNLESVSNIATTEISSIDPDKVDLDNTNILLYTGGTEKWHNFIKNDENAIYLLRKNGFEKIKSYDKANMGDYKTLLSFLDFGYDNYKADYYDLVFYDHGGAVDGAIYDDFTEDNLSLEDFSKALEKSAFDKNNKLNTVLFRTCLNGTLEVASIFAPYADYLIASEEITTGRGDKSVLNYLNDVKGADNAVDYGKKFISAYESQIDAIDPFKFYTFSTYSIIDLNKIDNVIKELNSFVKSIDVKNNYNDLVKMRSKMYQYAYTTYNENTYDMVDLYTLVNNLGKYSKKDSSKLLKAINEAIVYNWSDDETSKGVSIYFPYSGEKEYRNYFLNIYSKLDIKDYYDFINKFNSLYSSGDITSFAVSNLVDNDTVIEGSEFKLQLTEEQVKDYAESIYMVFYRADNGLYYPTFSSDNTTLDSDGVLKTNIANNMIKAYDPETPNGEYLMVNHRINGNNDIRFSTVVLESFEGDLKDWLVDSASAYYEIKDNEVSIRSYVSISDKNGVAGNILDPINYTHIAFLKSGYNILDEYGNYTEDWDNNGIVEGLEYKIADVSFREASLEDYGNYYCVFKIKDIYGNIYYSKLLNI